MNERIAILVKTYLGDLGDLIDDLDLTLPEYCVELVRERGHDYIVFTPITAGAVSTNLEEAEADDEE